MTTASGAWTEEEARLIIALHAGQEGAALPIFHALQHAFGFVPRDTVPMVAQALNISRAEAHGIVTFYHDFRSEPAGRHRLQLCRAEACQAMGARDLHAAALRRLGVAWGETSADGAVTVDAVYCLGLCACAPSAMLDGEVYGRLDAAALDDLLSEATR